MNWYERHLNLTWVLVCLVSLVTCFFVGVYTGFLILGGASMGTIETAETLGDIISWVVMIPVSFWVLHRKGRSPLWILLTGWFSPLWLSNKKQKGGKA